MQCVETYGCTAKAASNSICGTMYEYLGLSSRLFPQMEKLCKKGIKVLLYSLSICSLKEPVIFRTFSNLCFEILILEESLYFFTTHCESHNRKCECCLEVHICENMTYGNHNWASTVRYR